MNVLADMRETYVADLEAEIVAENRDLQRYKARLGIRPCMIDLKAESVKDSVIIREQLGVARALLKLAQALPPLADEELEAFKTVAGALDRECAA